MEWLNSKDATNALEQEDSGLNMGLNNSFLNYNRCFFLNSKFLFICLLLDRPKLFQLTVSDEFLKQCETEAFLKFNSCFSTEFARVKNTYVSRQLL